MGLLTPSHMVYSNDELIPAYAVQPGTLVDGQTVVLVANVTGHAMNVVTLRQDIVVNGMCATWLTEEFMPVAKLQFLWDLINHVAAFFPTVVFTSTQKISDFFVPLLDDGTIGLNTILAVMFSTGFLLVCISAAMVLSFYAVLHHFLGQWSHGSQIVVLNQQLSTLNFESQSCTTDTSMAFWEADSHVNTSPGTMVPRNYFFPDLPGFHSALSKSEVA